MPRTTLASTTVQRMGPSGFWRTWVATGGLLLAASATPVQAQSLVSLYETAKTYDASYQAALAQFEASRAKTDQAQAGLLPTVGLTAGANWTNVDSDYNAQDKDVNNQSVAVAASQPLYRPANRLANEQAQVALTAAEALLQQAEQDLVVRTAQAYFDLLAAQDSVVFVQAQKSAVAEQLAAAKRNFEVGTATITDTREAQARFDLVTAQEIAALNDVTVKQLALDQLVGQSGSTPWKLKPAATLPVLDPMDADTWVSRSMKNSPQLRQAQAGEEIAKLETRKAQAGHQPTLDAVAQYQVARGPSNLASPAYVRNHNATIGVQFNLPLFAGFAIQNRVKETLALQDKARSDVEAAKRSITQATRTVFHGLQAGASQVLALQAAEASSQSALDANTLGYQVGVRVNMDVLNAQSQLYQTKASLAKARYDVLVGGLRLKQVSGVLQASDLQPIHAVLVPSKP